MVRLAFEVEIQQLDNYDKYHQYLILNIRHTIAYHDGRHRMSHGSILELLVYTNVVLA